MKIVKYTWPLCISTFLLLTIESRQAASEPGTCKQHLSTTKPNLQPVCSDTKPLDYPGDYKTVPLLFIPGAEKYNR